MYKDVDQARKASIIRYVGLIIVLLNTVLTLMGMPILPIESAEVVSAFAVLVVGLYVGFKNNYLTRKGRQQAVVLEQKDLLKK